MDCDPSSWTPQRIAKRLATAEPSHDNCGDHDLNPDLKPALPLRPAAVLVGLLSRAGAFNIVFTQRTAHLQHHPGQISFPGGHVEPTDRDGVAAALRETEEEIGFPAQRIEVLGHLGTYITRTGFCITPVVGLLHPPFHFTPDPTEVAELFEVPLSFILNPANHQRRVRVIDGVERQFHALFHEEHEIWGATAGMLVDFRRVLMDENPAT